jgi:ribonucleoside-diphosphate reductase alpha chain
MRRKQVKNMQRTGHAAVLHSEGLKLSPNATEVLRHRYLLKDNQKHIIETPDQLFRRVARHVARAEDNFRSTISAPEAEEKFYELMRSLNFLPNSPTLMNAGTSIGQLSACFVIPVEDSMKGIFDALQDMAKIHQTGGGTGFTFSHLRPAGDLVESTKGQASGPISFMSIFDQATGVIVQGGRRRGANMGVLRCDHPDIVEFIRVKLEKNRFSNFNLSVGITDEFMQAYYHNKTYNLVNPRTKKTVGKVRARFVFDLITKAAWQTGDPGLVFLDEIDRKNPLPDLGSIETTNPCGELPLLPYESCNLASINLSNMANGKEVDWKKLGECVKWGVRFLDNVIEVNQFPLPQIRTITLANRKIGLGIMGFADLLIQLGIPYDSKEAIQFAQRLMHFIHNESVKASVGLAEERGVFPNFSRSIYAKTGLRMRNATVNSIAPTGTISIIAGCSSSIEPLFAVSFVRNVLSGRKLFEVNPLFEKMAKEAGIYNPTLLKTIASTGTLRKIKKIPADLRKLFVTAFDVTPTQHLQIQAAFQKHTDNAVSKTINLPEHATPRDVKRIYLLAYHLKCKGITIYRYGSKENQVLSFEGLGGNRVTRKRELQAGPEYSGGCMKRLCSF